MCVWGGISVKGVLGPVFFDGTVNGQNYLDMLTNVVVPQLRARDDYDELFFQQDGAPPHYPRLVRAFLTKNSQIAG